MENANYSSKSKTAISVVAVIGAFLLVGFVVRQMANLTRPSAVNAARAEERAKVGAETRAAGVEANKSWGYVDQAKGIVRVPVEDAVKLTVQGYQKPADFKKDLSARVEKANAVPPPPKNEFE